MNEKYIPIQDIKTGFRVVSKLTSSVVEEVKPYVKSELGKQFREILKSIKGARI